MGEPRKHKRIVLCEGCADCAEGYGFGFAGGRVRRCTRMGCDVGDGDGCTMGSLGTPMRLCQHEDVTLAGWEAVCGGRYA